MCHREKVKSCFFTNFFDVFKLDQRFFSYQHIDMGEIIARFYGTSDNPLDKMDMESPQIDELSFVRIDQSLCFSSFYQCDYFRHRLKRIFFLS